jgi:hypothetical protein
VSALASIETLPRVSPHSIFAAAHSRFDVTVRGVLDAREAKILIFRELPLEDHGWNFQTARIRHLRNIPAGMIFRMEKN